MEFKWYDLSWDIIFSMSFMMQYAADIILVLGGEAWLAKFLKHRTRYWISAQRNHLRLLWFRPSPSLPIHHWTYLIGPELMSLYNSPFAEERHDCDTYISTFPSTYMFWTQYISSKMLNLDQDYTFLKLVSSLHFCGHWFDIVA